RSIVPAPDAERDDVRVLEEQQLIGDEPLLALLDEGLLQVERAVVVDRPEPLYIHPSSSIRGRRPWPPYTLARGGTGPRSARVAHSPRSFAAALHPSLFELLEAILYVGQEAAGVGAVDQAVVVTERQMTRRMDRDGVVDDHGALFDRADTEDRDL